MYLQHRNLTKIPKHLVTDDLKKLFISNNQINKLENLPNSLRCLYCHFNQISKLENLPDSLIELSCWANEITKLTHLPRCLRNIMFDFHKIKFIDNLSIDYFNSIYCYT